jgi:hypothetical protein
MLATHFEQVRDLVHAEPACKADEPLIAFVLDTDPAIHGARFRGKTGAERGCTGTRTRTVPCGLPAAAAGGHLANGRDSSRGRHSQPVEYTPSIVTADGDRVDACAGAARVSSKSSVAELLLEMSLAPRALASNTLENPC